MEMACRVNRCVAGGKSMANPFPDEYFNKQDMSADERFYTTARKVVHIDDGAIAKLNDTFAKLLPAGGDYLDLMSSWRSHLPPTLKPTRVIGLGMNSEEMVDNPALTSHVVQNLNTNSLLPFEDATFDAVICTVSVQYLQRPIEVFQQVNRVLKPGGIFVVSFSNRCFPTKAVAIWMSLNDNQHIALVTRYFEESSNWADLNAVRYEGSRGWMSASDPLYIVHARKMGKSSI